MVMCVALGIPSPSKNPSLVNSSWAAGEQLGSLSAFASGTKKRKQWRCPSGEFQRHIWRSWHHGCLPGAFAYFYKMHKVQQCCLSSSQYILIKRLWQVRKTVKGKLQVQEVNYLTWIRRAQCHDLKAILSSLLCENGYSRHQSRKRPMLQPPLEEHSVADAHRRLK